MGRHGHTGDAPSWWRSAAWQRFAIVLIVAVLAVTGTVMLSVYWWQLRSGSDPISADPVDAQGIVISSPSCGSGGDTKISLIFPGRDDDVSATVDACGYAPRQRLSVQYLAGDPAQVRLAGSATAGSQAAIRNAMPFMVLAAGVVAIVSLIMLAVGTRSSSRRRARGRTISLAELRERLHDPRTGHGALGGEVTTEGTVVDDQHDG